MCNVHKHVHKIFDIIIIISRSTAQAVIFAMELHLVIVGCSISHYKGFAFISIMPQFLQTLSSSSCLRERHIYLYVFQCIYIYVYGVFFFLAKFYLMRMFMWR